MAKIKRSTAKQELGITEGLTGTTKILRFPQKDVITGVKEPVHVKRKNQYKRNK